jgi:N,N'-diacetyllegionaminate synthase
MKTVVIAEAGVNHNGDLGLAKELIDIAAESGADFIKFQTFAAKEMVVKFAPKAKYQIESTNENYSQFEMLRKLELSVDSHLSLIEYARSRNVKFLSTAFDISSIDMLSRLGQDLFKVPSGEITNLPYLLHLGRLNKEIILSTGMSNLDEIEAALTILEEAGTSKNSISILHCTSAYPAPLIDVNLRAIQQIRDAFNLRVGYSDHTLGLEVPVAAVALGAKIIEKHFTTSRELPGPDHKASLEPEELKRMISMIRNIEIAMGEGEKRAMPSELENREIVRKSIVAKQRIYKGDLFTLENLTTKRPGTGISPMRWNELIGNQATRSYSIDELIDET